MYVTIYMIIEAEEGIEHLWTQIYFLEKPDFTREISSSISTSVIRGIYKQQSVKSKVVRQYRDTAIGYYQHSGSKW